MITVSLLKFRRKMSKKEINIGPQSISAAGGKVVSAYWTLGQYDAIVTVEWPDEKAAMKGFSGLAEFASSETLVAVPREEALKLAGY
jgi:uncharacterized protein with GYD domain